MKTSKRVILSRQDEILSYIQRNNYIKISELAKAFGVSTATIRRDISTLEESGEDIRCKGGICIADTGNGLPKFDNERYFSSHTQEKEAIARKTAEFIEDGDTIFINGSSTAFRIIPHIKGKSVTIITNNGRSLFADRNYGTDLIIIGGEVIGNAMAGNMKMSMTGALAVEMISRISTTKCILGVSGISAEGGLTSMAVQDPAVNRAMIQHCNGPVIIAADHRKVGIRHNFLFGSLSDVSRLVTDTGSDPEELENIRRAGVEITLVDPDK